MILGIKESWVWIRRPVGQLPGFLQVCSVLKGETGRREKKKEERGEEQRWKTKSKNHCEMQRYSLKQILVANHSWLEAVFYYWAHSHSPHSTEPIRELGRVRACPILHMKQRERERQRQSKVTMLILFIFPDQSNTNSHSKGAVCVCVCVLWETVSGSFESESTSSLNMSCTSQPVSQGTAKIKALHMLRAAHSTVRKERGSMGGDIEIYRNMDM